MKRVTKGIFSPSLRDEKNRSRLGGITNNADLIASFVGVVFGRQRAGWEKPHGNRYPIADGYVNQLRKTTAGSNGWRNTFSAVLQ
jgi:hypothetical protein